jgi:hypothetical protein
LHRNFFRQLQYQQQQQQQQHQHQQYQAMQFQQRRVAEMQDPDGQQRALLNQRIQTDTLPPIGFEEFRRKVTAQQADNERQAYFMQSQHQSQGALDMIPPHVRQSKFGRHPRFPSGSSHHTEPAVIKNRARVEQDTMSGRVSKEASIGRVNSHAGVQGRPGIKVALKESIKRRIGMGPRPKRTQEIVIVRDGACSI